MEYISKTFSAAAPITYHLRRVVEKASAADSVLFYCPFVCNTDSGFDMIRDQVTINLFNLCLSQ